MSMLQYRKAHPRVRGICEKYGIPYVQEPVWERVKKTVAVMTGRAAMPAFFAAGKASEA
jgi:hypothetical protein